MKDGFPVSIAELLAAGHWPLPSEAVAIVLDVCRQVMHQSAAASVLPPISSATLFVDGSGKVAVAGGVPVEDDQTVALLGRLLLQMLPAAGTPGAARVPARLRVLAARAAAGQGPRLTIARLAAALRRYGPEQPRVAIRQLFERWREPIVGQVPDEPSVPAALPASEAPEEPEGGSGPAGRLRERAARMVRFGLMAAGLLVLLSMGATYWLHAKEVVLPPLPVNPAILLREPPPPPRNGWELLADPTGLAVDSGDQSAIATDGPPERDKQADQAVPPQGVQRPPAAGREPRLEAPFVHRGTQRP